MHFAMSVPAPPRHASAHDVHVLVHSRQAEMAAANASLSTAQLLGLASSSSAVLGMVTPPSPYGIWNGYCRQRTGVRWPCGDRKSSLSLRNRLVAGLLDRTAQVVLVE